MLSDFVAFSRLILFTYCDLRTSIDEPYETPPSEPLLSARQPPLGRGAPRQPLAPTSLRRPSRDSQNRFSPPILRAQRLTTMRSLGRLVNASLHGASRSTAASDCALELVVVRPTCD